ncbi:MAG: wax ester/triacylglycerol synthase domain-containing protein, partial [Solirubrobacteraceae bacterium]
MSGQGADHGQRLSALDGSFLRNETPQAHMHVAWSAVFAAPGDAARPTVEALRDRAAGRVHEVPWCRWRLEPAPLGLSEPRWIDDPDFDLSQRIVGLTDPDDPVSPATFAALRSELLSAPLDHTQPLWQIFLVPRLEDGRVGMVGKIHHSLVDGIAALQIVGLILDDEPVAASQPAVRWHPTEPAGSVTRAVDALTDAAGQGLRALQAGAGAATRPR